MLVTFAMLGLAMALDGSVQGDIKFGQICAGAAVQYYCGMALPMILQAMP